jgi:long-chain acyl-CoA synthetase
MAAVERERGTMFLGVPYIYALAVDMAEKAGIQNDLSSLRLCASAGAPLSVNIAAKFEQYFNYEILDCYGLTEAVCHVTCPPPGGTPRPGSVGIPLSGWEVKIVDDEDREVPPMQSGEMIIRGPVMKGYFDNPAATGEAVRDGWLYTGDIGMRDNDGFLYVTGRSKPTIIVKGQNVYPSDIESVIASHPGVAEVAVMGLPDAMRGEIIGAVITPREGVKITEQEIRQICLDRIASYKAPKKILFTGPMPRNAGGEIDKDALRRHLSLRPVFPVP